MDRVQWRRNCKQEEGREKKREENAEGRKMQKWRGRNRGIYRETVR